MHRKSSIVWVSVLVWLPLAGCSPEAIEQAFSADPDTSRWGASSSSPSPTLPEVSTTTDPQPQPQPQSQSQSQPKTQPTAAVALQGTNTSNSETNTETLNARKLKQSTPESFQDLEQAPEQFQRYIADLARLQVLTAAATPKDDFGAVTALFEPNQPIQQGTFARWLVMINNRIYRERPSRQIRLAAPTAQPAFTDIPTTDPLFPYIQGLAEAGYLPSALTGDDQNTTFGAERPLTRETLLTWKVPVDLRQILPTATANKIQDVWGFKDANQVSPPALAAVLADHKNGELANIRRLVGSALLLQPQKPVTRAEAAATLWFIGIEGEGFSAKDILRSERQAAASSSTTEISPSSP